MALITKTHTFSAGAAIIAAQHNTNFDTIYNDYNGNITNANIAAAAAIADTKLAQITTASKVSGTALTELASVPSGAGALPTANSSAMEVVVGQFTRDMTAASGDQEVDITGSFKPSSVIFFGGENQTREMTLIGSDDGTNAQCIFNDATANGTYQLASASIWIEETNGANYYWGSISSLDSDGFTITWTKVGTPSGTATINYRASR